MQNEEILDIQNNSVTMITSLFSVTKAGFLATILNRK